MKAHIQEQDDKYAELEAIWKKKMQDASVNGVLLGANTHAKIAMQNWGYAYRTATSQDEKIRIADELIDYIERTAASANDAEQSVDTANDAYGHADANGIPP